jgi:hypothetical protein
MFVVDRARAMSHPCDGHACDHCYLCDVVGICCATVPNSAIASHPCSHDTRLHEAVAAEASTTVGFAQLAQRGSDPRLLPAPSLLALAAGPSSAGQLLTGTTNPEQEAARVVVPRHHQQ